MLVSIRFTLNSNIQKGHRTRHEIDEKICLGVLVLEPDRGYASHSQTNRDLVSNISSMSRPLDL